MAGLQIGESQFEGALPEEGEFLGRGVQADNLQVRPGQGEDEGRGAHAGAEVGNR